MNLLTIEKAKPKLGVLIDRAGEGDKIFIVRPHGKRGRIIVQLVPVRESDPIPHIPLGAIEVNRATIEAMDTYPVFDEPFLNEINP